MQAFGIGPLELLLILVLMIIVVGPERLPAVAAELARWIRRARSYAQYMARDFNEVISEIEKEAGTTREDWKEIAGVIGLQAKSLTDEIGKVAAELKEAADVQKTLDSTSPAPPTVEPPNVVPIGTASSRQAADGSGGVESVEPASESGSTVPAGDAAKEEPWYVPDRPRRRQGGDQES